MATKLDWQYDDASGEYLADVPDRPDLRIRAVLDTFLQNPMTDGDCNWPLYVRSGGRNDSGITHYDAGVERKGLDCPLDCFNDALLMHWQIHIAKLLGSTVRDLIECHGNSTDELPEGKVICRDAEVLRDVFKEAWDNTNDSKLFDMAVEMFKMCDIVALSTTTQGYSQGDYAELLVVAYPSAIERFGCKDPIEAKDLQSTADLYGAWAWGDVYGYVIEVILPGEDEDDNPVFEEVDACWGFYGSDFGDSGLEDSALEAIPDRVPELADA